MPKGTKLMSLGKRATEYACPFCEEYTTRSETGLRLHVRKKHELTFTLVSATPCCTVCDTRFESREQLKNHCRLTKCFEKK